MVRLAGRARAKLVFALSVFALSVFALSVFVAVIDPAAAGAATAPDSDLIPEHVAMVYDYAAATAPCPVSFAALAGIGTVTSDNTRVGGEARMLPDGSSEPTILYERLEPGAPSGLLPDTDGGTIDGSDEVDTTVGPMQFLPETWIEFGVDGNGDGVADPNNLWDAAAAAANRLCEAAADTDLAGALTAYFGTDIYNEWVFEAIAEAGEWQALVRPAPERRDADVVAVTAAPVAISIVGAQTVNEGVPTIDDFPIIGPVQVLQPGEVQVAGSEQLPAAALATGFIGPLQPVEEASLPIVAPGESTVSGDWDGTGEIGTATLTVTGDRTSIVRTDAEGRPYGRATDVTAELADPEALGGLAVGDWEGDGIDDLVLLVASAKGVDAIRLDRGGVIIDSTDLGVLSPGSTIVVEPAPAAALMLGGEEAWKTLVAHDGSVLDLWKVGGIIVEKSMVEQTSALLAAAAGDGVTLEGWGWRSHDAQIELRRAHCGDIWATPASACSPPTAVPGTSRHEYGTAIDFHANTVSLSANSPEFAWLSEHAAEFGFYNLASEPWHWSVDGG